MNDNEYNDQTAYASLIIMIIIQVILVILKFGRILNWSWWIILLPIEISIGAVFIIFIIIDAIFVVEMYKDYRKHKNAR